MDKPNQQIVQSRLINSSANALIGLLGRIMDADKADAVQLKCIKPETELALLLLVLLSQNQNA